MDTKKLVEQFTIAGPVDLTIRATDADIKITASPDLATHVVLMATTEDDLHAATVKHDGSGLTIDVPSFPAVSGPSAFTQFGWGSFRCGAHADTRLAVQVPSAGRLTLQTQSGDVTVDVAVEQATLELGSGDLDLDKVGQASIKSGSGDIVVHDAGEVSAMTGSGDIRVETAGSVRAKTGPGDITVTRCEGNLEVKTGSGDVCVERAGGDVTAKTASGDISVGGIAHGKVNATTASGDLALRFSPGIPVWTNATSVSGDVSNDLSPRGEPSAGQPFVEVVARTVSGDLTLTDD